MRYNLIISQKAEGHIQSAYHWYEQQKNGLGNNFLDAIDIALLSIQSNPMFYSFRRKNIRGCITKRFPYIILFYIKQNNIRVVSVFHMSMKP